MCVLQCVCVCVCVHVYVCASVFVCVCMCVCVCVCVHVYVCACVCVCVCVWVCVCVCVLVGMVKSSVCVGMGRLNRAGQGHLRSSPRAHPSILTASESLSTHGRSSYPIPHHISAWSLSALPPQCPGSLCAAW